jgi:flagella basal body P-ring formation protein FlgA
MIFRLMVSFLVCLVPITATELVCQNIESTIRDRLLSKIRTNYPTITFQSLTVQMSGTNIGNDCTSVQFLMPDQFSLDGDFVVKFDVLHSDNAQRRVTKVFRVLGKALVYRIKKHVEHGDVFSKHRVYQSIIDVSDLTQRMVGDLSLFQQYQFRNYVDKDHIVESWMLAKIPDILKGSFVHAIYAKPNITLTLDAVVLENGSIGDTIKVKLKKNQKVCLGKVHDKKNMLISSC